MKAINELEKEFFNFCETFAIEIAKLRQQDPKEEESWDVKTPVSLEGNILFNSNRQCLGCLQGVYWVEIANIFFGERQDKWKWVRTTRDKLKPGDTAYRSDLEYPNFTGVHAVCKIMNDDTVVCVENNTDVVSETNGDFEHWFKLVLR